METLSSYLAAWRGHFHVEQRTLEGRLQKIDPTVLVALQEDPDYPAHPGWKTALTAATNLKLDVFEQLGSSHGPWPLLPHARRCACLACLEMRDAPNQQFICDFWNQSTITVCWFHSLPLVEVPAVGWGWSELSAATRQRRHDLMVDPGKARRAQEQVWSPVEEDIRNAVYFAEMTCWAECTGNQRILSALEHQNNGALVVWRDLLTLLCTSWEPFASPSVALLGIPASLWCRFGSSKFGGANCGILLEEPTFDLFRSISNPSERRSCVLIAWDAIRPLKSREILPRSVHSRFGWRSVVRWMPDRAWNWLTQRASRWPGAWQAYIGLWEEERSRVQVSREQRRGKILHHS
jgi:hypothetical protein